MRINDIELNANLSDILFELQTQLMANNIPLLQKTKETTTHIQVQCPYHSNGQERKPSAGIRKSDGVFHCFACGEVHSLQEVITHCFGHYDDIVGVFGVKWLMRNFASIQVEERKDVEIDYYRVRSTYDKSVVDNLHYTDGENNQGRNKGFVVESELDKYRYYHPYWTKRGITDENIIELFDLGYDKETDCITFPVRDIKGNCLFIARRSVKTKYFNYPQGVEKPLYGLYELSCIAGWYGNQLSKVTGNGNVYVGLDWKEPINEVIITEAMIDGLTCWQYGKYAVALNGLGNQRQFTELQQLPCRELILATDNDEAGMKARDRIRKNVRNKIITEYILPKGKKDINELSKEEFLNLKKVL